MIPIIILLVLILLVLMGGEELIWKLVEWALYGAFALVAFVAVAAIL